MERINSTGTLWLDDNLNYFSYNSQLTGSYKNLRVFNNTYYSITTRKHQSKLWNGKFDLILSTCQFGTRLTEKEVEKSIKLELDYIDNYLLELSIKRNTQKKLATIEKLNNKKEFLKSVLAK